MSTERVIWVVGHDFSDPADVALRRAAELIACVGREGRLVLVHAHRPIATGFGLDAGTGAAPTFVDTDAAVAHDDHARLDALVQEVAARWPGVSGETRFEIGDPADVLCAVAAELGAALIVVGSHGRRGLERLLLGSVAERVVRYADRSVLVVKGASVALS